MCDSAAYGEGRDIVLSGGKLRLDLSNLAGDEILPFDVSVYHEDTEFVSADSADVIVRAEVFLQDIHESGQDSVACRMAILVVDLLKLVYVKEQQIGCSSVNAGQKQVVSGPVVRTGQFIMRGLEVQILQTPFINLIHLVVRLCQVPELAGPDLGQRVIILNPVHCFQDRIDSKPGGQPYDNQKTDRLQQDDEPDDVHLQAKGVQ